MKRYEKYKPSGIEWIGEIPVHWTLATVGRVSNLGRGRVISSIEIGENPGEFPVYSSQTENNGVMGYLNSFNFDGEYVTWTTDGANAGTVFFRKGKFNCTNVCGTIQPKYWEQIDLRFIPYLLNLGTKYSVRLDINPKLMNNMMAKIPIVVPPKEEQITIATYLDRKTAQIDDLIDKKEKLIDVLNEEKTAVINQAMTKGLNPNTPMKDSGIPWLGEIPAHWEVKKLKYLASKVGSGITPLGGAAVYQKSGVPLLRSQNIHFDGLMLDDVAYISEEIDEEMSNSRIAEGDVLLNITGASVGRCYFVDGALLRGNVNQHVCIIRPIISRIKTIYLYYLLRSYMGQRQIVYLTSGANREGLNFEQIKAFTFGIPDLEEQIKTIAFLQKETEKIGNVQAKIGREIELLQEYRTALISEAVTGKIDVRGVN